MRVNEGLYKRRGGMQYLRNYMHMKNVWRKQGVGNCRSMLYSDLMMTISNIIPIKMRKMLYQKILHKS